MSDNRRFRVLVTVTEKHHPELYEQLARVPKEARAERLRSLGLAPLVGDFAVAGVKAETPPEPVADVEKRDRLVAGFATQLGAA